jgi:hypothetical protein
MFIGHKFRAATHRTFSKEAGLQSYLALRVFEAKEKAKKKSRALNGAAVVPDFKAEDFKWTSLRFS